MQLIQEIIGSTAIVVGTIGSLLIALSITSIKLMIARAEQREAILLAAEQSEQTREAMHQLQQTLGSIHAQVWYLDTQARVVSYNHLAEQFLGVDPLQVRGRPMTALLPSWHEPHQAQSRNEQVLLTGQAMLGTLESFDCEGGICWMNVDRLPSYNAP